jgi:predicted type IV restriction endonuclease
LSSEKFKGIWPLPGGVTKYIDTLTRILKKIQETNPTFEELLKWFMLEYKLSGEKTPRSYLDYIKRFRFFKRNGERLSLTEEALKFLESGNYNIVYEVLNNAVLGLDDILSWLSEEPLSEDEIHERLVKKYNLISWKKTAQTYFRLGWLMSLRYVERKGRKYYLTDEGLKAIRGKEAEKPVLPVTVKPAHIVTPTPIEKYISHATALIKEHPDMNELNTISTLIEPLLEVLGWSIRDPDEVQREYPVRIGDKTEYVDIALKINNRPVVFIEAKAVGIPLQDHLAEQPIKYANAEGVSWCMLTNGRELRVYNAFWKIKGIEQKMLFKLSIDEFKEKIGKLQLLSKEHLTSGKLDDEGEFEHAKRMASEWFKQKENNIVKGIMELDPSLKEEYIKKVLRKIL